VPSRLFCSRDFTRPSLYFASHSFLSLSVVNGAHGREQSGYHHRPFRHRLGPQCDGHLSLPPNTTLPHTSDAPLDIVAVYISSLGTVVVPCAPAPFPIDGHDIGPCPLLTRGILAYDKGRLVSKAWGLVQFIILVQQTPRDTGHHHQYQYQHVQSFL